MRTGHRNLMLATALMLVEGAAAEDYQLYRGLMHAHTHYSDGRGDPDQAFAEAEDAGLDFFAVTEHNHNQAGGHDGIFLTPQLYEQLKASAQRATRDGQFVALYGQEVSSISKGNHVNVFNSPTIVDITNGDFRDLYERYLVDHPETALVQFNHPDINEDRSRNTSRDERNNDYGIDDYHQSYRALVAAADHHVSLIELIIGPAFERDSDFQHHDGRHERDYIFYLNEGFRLGPSAGQDNHFENWGRSTEARLGLWAPELTEAAVYTALRARRTFASEDRNLSARLMLGDVWMGDTARLDPATDIELSLHFDDTDEPDATYVIRLFYDDAIGGDEAAIVDIVDATANDSPLTFPQTPDLGGYYFAKLTQRSNAEFDADDAWTAPIWIAQAEDPDPGIDHGDTDVIPWQQAPDFEGEEKKVRGTIVDSFTNQTALFLNFAPNFRETLTLVIFANDLNRFGGAQALEQRVMGKELVVEGVISTFRGRPQIILRSTDQLIDVAGE